MVPGPSLLAFALAAVALIVIPGPSVLFVIGRSLALGRLGCLLSVLGNALGMLPLVVAVSLGIGAVVAQSLVLFTIIKFAGAAYLVYLGIQAIRHRRHTAVTHEAAPPSRSPWRILGEGFLVGLVVAIAAPLGDLCQSLVKRDLGVKDMGSILPGHGGLLDRFDGLLFVLPAVWLLAVNRSFFV